MREQQEYELPADGNVILVVENDMDLEASFGTFSVSHADSQVQVKDPVTGEFVPYDEGYISKKAANRHTAYEDTYFIPPGKIVEFQDEEGNVLYR